MERDRKEDDKANAVRIRFNFYFSVRSHLSF